MRVAGEEERGGAAGGGEEGGEGEGGGAGMGVCMEKPGTEVEGPACPAPNKHFL